MYNNYKFFKMKNSNTIYSDSYYNTIIKKMVITDTHIELIAKYMIVIKKNSTKILKIRLLLKYQQCLL